MDSGLKKGTQTGLTGYQIAYAREQKIGDTEKIGTGSLYLRVKILLGKDKGRILNIKYSDGDRGWPYKGERKKGNMIILNFEC